VPDTSGNDTAGNIANTIGGSTGTGATIGTAIGGPVVGTAVGGIIGGLIGIFSKMTTATKHLNSNQGYAIAIPLMNAIVQDINSDAPSSVQDVKDNFPIAASNAMKNCNWWKVGNDQTPDLPGIIIQNPTTENAIVSVLDWGFRNAPSDNFHDAYAAITEIFDKTLYPILDNYNQSLTIAIDNAISKICGTTSTVVQKSPATIASTGTNNLSNALGSILGGGTTASTSTSTSTGTGTSGVTKAGLSPIVIILILGALLGVFYMIFKKGKPA
jgi:hypothetical protein